MKTMISSKASTRKPEVETFRCMLMLLIVLYHSYMHGIFSPGRGNLCGNPWWGFLFSSILVWHVDGFVAISGWYGIRFSFRKFASFYGLIVYYSLLWVLILAFTRTLSFNGIRVYAGWFGGCYLVLMLVAPFLNAGIANLKKGVGLFILAFFLSLEPICRFTGICASGFSSQSFLSIVLVYVVTGLTKRFLRKPVKASYLIMAMAMFPIFVLSLNILFRQHLGTMTSVYHYPHVYIFGIAMFLLFLWHVRVPKWLGAISGFVSPSIFAIYLIHDVLPCGKLLYILPEKWFMAYTSLHPIGVIFFSAIIAFVLCILIDLPRRYVCSFIKLALSPLMNSIDERLNAMKCI